MQCCIHSAKTPNFLKAASGARSAVEHDPKEELHHIIVKAKVVQYALK